MKPSIHKLSAAALAVATLFAAACSRTEVTPPAAAVVTPAPAAPVTATAVAPDGSTTTTTITTTTSPAGTVPPAATTTDPSATILSTTTATTPVAVTPAPAAGTVATGTAAASTKTTVGTDLDDTVVTTKVKSALVADSQIKALQIKVETRKGQVQLSGFADSQAQIDRALTVAKGVQGVTGVENSMSLKQGERTVGVKVDDGIVTAKVKSALLADPSVKALDIIVATNKGQVQLSGYVDSKSQMDQAVLLAKGVEGVTGVESKMSLKK